MHVIGFTTKFYTLWTATRYVAWTKGREPRAYWATAYQYLRNLSMELPAAEKKLKDQIGDESYTIDPALRGTTFFIREEPMDDEDRKQFEKDYTFTFGRLKGVDIRIAGEWITEHRQKMNQYRSLAEYYGVHDAEVDAAYDAKAWKDVIWQLERAMKSESTARRKVYARRRLIELGALVRRNWVEKRSTFDPYSGEVIGVVEVKRKWMPKGLAAWHETIGDKKGLFYTDGERRLFDLQELKVKALPSDYGTLYIITYVDTEGHIITYKGGTVPSKGQKAYKAKATVKHKNGETYIQRVKVIA